MTSAGRPPADRDSADGRPGKCAPALQPIVRFGVTGHRDALDLDAAARSVTDALCLVLATLEEARAARGPGRGLRPAARPAAALGCQVVSPLAEGPDRVVAGMVLSSDARLQARPRELVVPLPFPLDYYRGTGDRPGSDCSDSNSQAEFDRLRAAACWTRSLHDYPPASERQRDAGYRDVGRFVVEHSDLLIALWDGHDNKLEGGTAAVVRLALRRGVPVIWVPVTRRSKSAAGVPGSQVTGTRLLVLPATAGDELAEAVRTSLDLFSSSAAAVLAGRASERQPVQDLLIERLARLGELLSYASGLTAGGLARDGLPGDALAGTGLASGSPSHGDLAGGAPDATPADPAVRAAVAAVSRWIDPPYLLADAMARRYQGRLRAMTIGVYAAAATAVALGAFAAIMFPYGGAWRLPVVFEAIVLVALLAVQWLDLRRIWRDRWVAFRAMSEYLRIGRYLALVTPRMTIGLDFNRVVRLSAWSSEPSLTPWFAPVLERLWDRRPDPRLTSHDVSGLRNYIIADWVNHQIRYHEGRQDSHRRWDRNLRWAIQVTLFATVLAVALHVLRDYFPGFLAGPSAGRDLASVTLAFLVIVLTSIAAAFNGYAGQQRHGYHQARFRRMARELQTIRALLDQAMSVDQLQRAVSEVRRVTLGEATDWFEDMRDQQIESPT